MAYEKMRCLYDTERDLIDRLQGTICRYKNKAFVVAVQSRSLIWLNDLVTGKMVHEIKPSDPDFDISSPEIGYLNWQDSKGRNKAYFLERNPYRKYRQGLYSECCTLYHVDGKRDMQYPSSIVFKSRGIIDSIEGTFPSFREAFVGIRQGRLESVAISRDIALDPMKCGVTIVYCQGNDIGYIKHDSSKIEIKEDDTAWVINRMLEKSGIRMRYNNG